MLYEASTQLSIASPCLLLTTKEHREEGLTLEEIKSRVVKKHAELLRRNTSILLSPLPCIFLSLFFALFIHSLSSTVSFPFPSLMWVQEKKKYTFQGAHC